MIPTNEQLREVRPSGFGTSAQDAGQQLAPYKGSGTRPCRKGLKPATCYISPEARRQIRKLAWERDTTIENLLREALDCLFAKHSLPEIAQIKGKGGPA
jgi:hypothetical protein